MRMVRMVILAVVALAMGCNAEPDGLTETQAGGGPTVVWDMEAKPLPDIPFPIDLATRYDRNSPTLRRLNLSLMAPTELEADIRAKANQLDGFGTYAPISVSFDAPIDLDDLHKRHVDNLEFADDAVFLVDVTPDSPTYGQPTMLDMGRGFFPLSLKRTNQYFPNDPRGEGTNLLFETYKEEKGEDSDGDRNLDAPNVRPEGGDPWDDLITHYESESNTLLVRPVVPLRERTRYAVVITRRVRGAEGTGPTCDSDSDCPVSDSCDKTAGRCREPVRSPFKWSNHSRQTEELEPLREILAGAPFDLDVEQVAFAWTFTTQSITSTMVAIRRGLYGVGSMAYLAEEFPAAYRLSPGKTPEKAKETGSVYILTIDELMAIGDTLLPSLKGIIPSLDDSSEALIESFEHLDYIVAGTFKSPHFLVDRDGHAAPGHPADDDESFEINPETGEAVYGTTNVPFVCMIPKEKPAYADKDYPHHTGKKPFPVAIFMHGTGSSKLQGLAFPGLFARVGIATCAIDAFAHGMPFPANPVAGGFMSEENVIKLINAFAPGYGPIYDIMKGTRARDLNLDGNLDPAGDFWTMDPFHTRDCIRQTAVDLIQFTRIMRSMDGKTKADVDGDGNLDLLGDFDKDGKPDIGGPDNRYFAYGISLGGIVVSVFAGVEPALDAATVIVGGGGLADVAVRSTNPGVPEMAIMPAFGPVVIGSPDPDDEGRTVLEFVMPVFDHMETLEIARLDKAAAGRVVQVTNLETGRTEFANVPEDGLFRVQIPADALRATELRTYTGFDPLIRVGGESCQSSSDCADPLQCRNEECGCQGDDECPATFGCLPTARCIQVPQPIDTPLETDEHPMLGDRFVIEVLNDKREVIETVDKFHLDVQANGVVYQEGAPLVNLYRGFGNQRQTPDFRSFMSIAQTILEPGDPANWARYLVKEPIAYPEADPDAKPGTNVLVLLGVGDSNVPVSTGIAFARALGAVGYAKPSPRFGDKTEMDILVDNYVVEGIFNRCRYVLDVVDKDGEAHEECILYDIDELDGARDFGDCADNCAYQYDEDGEANGWWACSNKDGEICGDGFAMPHDLTEPLRATAVPDGKGGMVPAHELACIDKHADGTCRVFKNADGVAALRFPVTRPEGFHGLYLMAPYKPFDVETYQLNLIARYFITSGQEVWDDACLEDSSCSWEPAK